MKRKFLVQGAAVLASFAASCGLCCWFFSGANLFESEIADRMIVAVAGKESPVIVP